MDNKQKINQVQVGQKITANKINQLIDAANTHFNRFDPGGIVPGESIDNLNNTFYHNWQVNEYQSKLNDEGKLDVKNTYIWTGENEILAEQYDNVTEISGNWYAGYKKDLTQTGPIAIYTNNKSSLEDTYYFQQVFTIYQHEEIEGEVVNPTNSIVYHNIHPTFGQADGGGGGGEGETQGAFRWSVSVKTDDEGEEYYSGTFKYCNFQFGRKIYQPTKGTWDDMRIPEDGCTYYLHIYHSAPEAAVIVGVSQANPNTLDETNIPLITVNEQGIVTNDFRGMPVIPVWGTPEG